MPQSLSNLFVHLVFSTKNRVSFITSTIEPELYAYIASILNEHGCQTILINGMPDHVHILFNLSRTMTLADVVSKVKANTSRWIKTKGPDFSTFGWQSGYGAFSVGVTDKDRAISYIRAQKTHHQKQSFQDEFREMLQRAGIKFDERYAWD